MPILVGNQTRYGTDRPIYATEGGGGVTSITAGTGIAVTGTASVPIVSNTGVLSVTAGTGISVTGTATAPVINATATIFPVNFYVDEFNGDAQLTATTTGSAATAFAIPGGAPVPGGGGETMIPVSNMGKYQIAMECALVSTSTGGSMGIQIYRVDVGGVAYGPAYAMVTLPESTSSSEFSVCANFYARPSLGPTDCAGILVQVVGDAADGTVTGTIYNLSIQALN